MSKEKSYVVVVPPDPKTESEEMGRQLREGLPAGTKPGPLIKGQLCRIDNGFRIISTREPVALPACPEPGESITIHNVGAKPIEVKR